ncbi:hypothetical protein [Flavobacterium sp. JP2137]|uniref:hypothetical protein n=1 Tax=Flavobacterium sp. JP2137 TaxID=3414510 RepID=UPI003D2FD1E8
MKLMYFLFLCCVQTLVAQTYHPDKIQIDGISYDYRYHHLESYFNYYPEKRPVINKDSTIISRGYIAEYEIADQQLYLRDLKIPVNGNYQELVSQAKKVLPENASGLKMHWIDGLFDVGLGNPIILHAKDSLNPIFDSYYILEIKRGVVKTTQIFNYKQYKSFKDYQWERFRNTPEYRKIYDKLQQTTMDPIDIQGHIYNHILFYSKRNFLKKSI